MSEDEESLEPLLPDTEGKANQDTGKTNPLAWLLFVFVGMAPFLLVNANWSEIPLYEDLPEHQQVGAYVGMFQQVSNVIPFAYVFIVSSGWISPSDTLVISSLYVLAFLDALCLALFWSKVLAGFSLALFVCCFTSGIIGGMFVMVVWSFMAPFKPVYTSALSAGMGLSGLVQLITRYRSTRRQVPAGYAMLQKEVDLSVQNYFLTCLAILVVSAVAFALVQWKGSSMSILREVEGQAASVNDASGSITRTTSLDRLKQEAYIPINCCHVGRHKDVHVSMKVVLAAAKFKRLVREGGGTPRSPTTPTHDPPTPLNKANLAKAAASPLINMLLTNVITYVMMPGYPPFMVKGFQHESSVILYITLGFMIANTAGRIVAGFYVIGRLFGKVDGVYILMSIQSYKWPRLEVTSWQLAIFIYLTAVACTGSTLFLPHQWWILVVLVGVFSVLNGYIITVIYCAIPSTNFACGHNDQAVGLVCRWTAVVEQVGALAGGLVCMAMVKGHLL